MSDIFLSYAREDRGRARALAAALEGLGWSVFWDVIIPAGSTWEKVLEKRLAEARCVVVAWSEAAAVSEWVLEEASEGRERKILVPVKFEEVKPPFGYRSIHAADLVAWDGDVGASEFRRLAKAIGGILEVPPEQVEEEVQRLAEAIGAEEAERRTEAKKRRSLAAKRAWETRRKKTKEQKAAKKKPVAEKRTAPKKTAAKKKARSKKTVAKEPLPSRRPTLKTGAGAPTWEEDEQLNPRILVEGGEFLMGSSAGVGDDDEHPQRRVTLSPFELQQHEVTNEEYRRFDADHDFKNDYLRHPVAHVSWDEAMAYAAWLGGSLPTEAQWEFSARGKEGREYPWGPEDPTEDRANYGDVSGGTTRVGSYPATGEGFYDLAGNVWEWCRDWHGPSYPEKDEVDPLGPETGVYRRVLRGGSFSIDPRALRGAFRTCAPPGSRNVNLGFRVAWSSAGGLD